MELCTIPATSTLPLQLPALQSFYIESTGMKILKKWQLQGYCQFLILTQSAQQLSQHSSQHTHHKSYSFKNS